MPSGGYTLNETKNILREYGIRPVKGLGQNFITDKNILAKILSTAQLNEEDQVLEIGPGIGTLTAELAKRVGKVVTVEIDRRLIPVLERTLKPFDNVIVINADILSIDIASLWREHFSQRVKVVANLPYYITSPIVMKLLEEDLSLDSIVVMVQKEVAKRMNARPGVKDYGALSVAVQYRSFVDVIAEIPPGAFMPPPKVVSALVRLSIKEIGEMCTPKDERLMFQLVRAAFGQRRKTLSNALHSAFKDIDRNCLIKNLRDCGIDPQRRGETLSVEEFCRLADYMYNKGQAQRTVPDVTSSDAPEV